jgi:outer membrane protein assembly factor BamB
VELITASTQRPLPPAVTENVLIGRSQIYNIEDGSVVAELPASSVQPPLVHEGIITLVADSEIRGVDAQSRQQSWSYLPSATVSGLAAGGGHLFAIIDDTTLIALDIQNGDKLWEREAERIFGYTAGRLFATSGSSNFAVNPSDGSTAYNIDRNIKAVGQDGSVYVGNIAKLNAEDGSEIWNSSGLDEVLAVDDEYLYGRTSSIGGNFAAVSASDGEQAWSKELETRSIAVGSNRVYTSSLNRIFALSKDTGEEQARYAVGGPDGLRVGQGALVTIENAEATVLTNQ